MGPPIIFYSSPRTLQEISASQCALLCWRLTYSLHYDLYPNETTVPYWFVSCRSVSSSDIFQLPKRISQLIDRYVVPIGIRLYSWAQNSFNDHCRDIILNCFDDIVLDPEGEICYKTTAMNLLNNEKVNLVEKYAIACWYGFENVIKQLWPLVSNDSRVTECQFDRQPTMYYWNYRMMNKLHKIPGDEHDSAELRMMSSGKLCFWSEMEYFWNKLNDQEQISKIIKIPEEGAVFVSKHVIPKLTHTQLDYILKKIPSAVVVNLATEGENTDYAWQSWNYVKHVITSDKFYEILQYLWYFAYNGGWSFVNNVAVFLYDIWSTAEDNLKKDILHHSIELFFDNLDKDRVIESYGCDIKFLLDLFSNASFNLKKKLWCKKWRQLILLARPSELEKLMEACFENEQSVISFKEIMMLDHVLLESEFNMFIKRGLCRELVSYLQFCSSNDERIRSVRKHIVDSNIRNAITFSSDVLVSFNEFIDGTFTSHDLAYNFKENFLRKNLFTWYDMLGTGNLTDVKNIINSLSSRKRFLTSMKRKLFEYSKSILSSGSFIRFCIREWDEFLSWCASNGKKIMRLKRSLSVDFILQILLPQCIREEVVLPTYYSRLDSFLRWYFVTEEATKRYKLNTIIDYQKVDIVKEILQSDNEEVIFKMLSWFFHYDLSEVEKFRNSITKAGCNSCVFGFER